MPAINPDRVLGDLYKLREFGTYKTGVHRPTFSVEDIAARNWFAEQCSAAGLDTTIDGIGNIFGKSKANGAKALSGSHLESQNHAGLGLVRLLSAIDKRFPEICGPRTVWTTGRITLDPGSHSIIPGRADSLFQLRDADPAVLEALHNELFALIEAANRDGRCKLE